MGAVACIWERKEGKTNWKITMDAWVMTRKYEWNLHERKYLKRKQLPKISHQTCYVHLNHLWYTICFCFVFLQNRTAIQTQGSVISQLTEQHIYLTIRKGEKFCSSSEGPLVKNWFSQWGSHVLLVNKMLSHGMIFTTKLPKMEDLSSK